MAEGARLEIVCMPTKVYRGFESRSLRQINNVETLQAASLHSYTLESLAQAIAKFELIPADLSIKSSCQYLLKIWPGPVQRRLVNPVRSGRKQRQQIPSCVAANPVTSYIYLPYKKP